MQNLDKYLSGVDAEKLKSVLASGGAEKLSKIVDPKAVEAAAQRGDSAALARMISKLLTTEEGRRLAAQLGKNGK